MKNAEMKNAEWKAYWIISILAAFLCVGCVPGGQDTPQAALLKWQRSIAENDYGAFLECSHPKGRIWNEMYKRDFAWYRATLAFRAALEEQYGKEGMKRFLIAAEEFGVWGIILVPAPGDTSWVDAMKMEIEDSGKTAYFTFDTETCKKDKLIKSSWCCCKQGGKWFVVVHPLISFDGDSSEEEEEEMRFKAMDGDNLGANERCTKALKIITSEISQKWLSPEEAYVKVRKEASRIIEEEIRKRGK